MCSPENPLFTPLLQFARAAFQAKETVHKTPYWENFEILASAASIFTQILAQKPPNLEIFSSQAPNWKIFSSQATKFENFQFTIPPFQRQISVRKPHTLEIRAAHPYLKKKSSTPPGFKHMMIIILHCTAGFNINTALSQNYQNYFLMNKFYLMLSPGIGTKQTNVTQHYFNLP